jgi:tRNA A-37 threonylcarbamoyl transferase component Bud32
MAIFVLGAGLLLERSVGRELSRGLEEDLLTIRDSNVAALEQWMASQERIASLSASEPEAREASLVLIEASRSSSLSKKALVEHPMQERLRQVVAPTMQHWEFEECLLVADDVIVAARDEAAIGRRLQAQGQADLQNLRENGSLLSRPRRSEDWKDERRLSMWVASPIRDSSQKMQGALVFRIDPRASFTKILRTAERGKTGETYAFDAEGLMLSGSRFDPQLRKSGLLEEGQESLLTLKVQESGVDLTQPGARALKGEGPLTVAVLQALSGQSEVNVDGYKDYRGATVVGAWKWLPNYGFGVVTELDKTEAHQSVAAVRRGTRGLVLVLLVSAILLVLTSSIISRLQRAADKAERLGQYTLERKLGEGGMGAVYQARHALLRRPTAIKMIRPESIDERTRERFEREVQATAKLCHPNTIAVYDYGRTAQGVFYYAMEFLAGIDLHDLVKEAGPIPESRVLHILAQVLGSLTEAHEQGMVHRDIKPPNIMLCRRGGVADLVKVLDFGLVKNLEADDGFTQENVLTGTPQYMAPEAVTNTAAVDQRTDLYAVAAVGFYLLTARQLFTGPSVMSILTKQLTDPPPRPSEVSENPVSPALEGLLLRALEKDQDKRPPTARQFLAELEEIRRKSEAWTQADAQKWWDGFEASRAEVGEVGMSEPPHLEVDLVGRTPTV